MLLIIVKVNLGLLGGFEEVLLNKDRQKGDSDEGTAPAGNSSLS